MRFLTALARTGSSIGRSAGERRLGLTILCLSLVGLLGACGGDQASSPGPTATLPIDPTHLRLPDEFTFTKGTLEGAGLSPQRPTTLAFGPDGRLYVGEFGGRVVALTLSGVAVEDVEVLVPADVLGNVLGLAFNPADPPDPVTVYVSHTLLERGEAGPLYPGKVSKLVAPNYEPLDVITGLPVSATIHGTNGIAFDRSGTLYIAQGSGTNAGVPSETHPRPETPLSAAILVARPRDPGFDGQIKYEPADEAGDAVDKVAGDVEIYAAGMRNPYDLVLHSNGRIYATDNGPEAPSGNQSTSCASEGQGPFAPDELNLIVEGRYYGHANRNRGRFDSRQCTYRAPDDTSGDAAAPLATLGYSVSANGLTEYASNAFDGRLKGDLIYVEWIVGRIWRVQLSDDGGRVESISQLVPDLFVNPLDVVVGPDGTLYIAEWALFNLEQSAGRIAYLRPSAQELLD